MSAQQPAKDSTRLVIPVAAVIALAIMGDSLMYSLLPLQAERLGFSLAGVGLLLSANRIIRLLSNTWAGLAFERFGSRAPFIFAAVLSVLTTWLYGAGMGFAVFFLARAGWGVAWSILRQGGFVAVWAAGGNQKGRLMGSLWGMVRVGSAVSVLLGGYLYDRYGFSTAVSAITVVTLFAIPGAMLIRWPHNHFAGTSQARSPLAGLREGLANSPRRWLLVVGFLYTFMEALIAVTLSKYIQLNYGDTITTLGVGIGIVAGVMLALRYTADFIFAPLLGALSDHFGQPRTIALLTLLILANIVAAVSTPGLWPLLFLALVFFSGSGMFAAANAAASVLAQETERPHLFVSLFTTAIDSGAAAGPLIAFPLANLVGFDAVYIAAAVMLAIASVRFWRVNHAGSG